MRLYARELFARIYCFQTQSMHLTSVAHVKSFKLPTLADLVIGISATGAN